jgi:hypothetical protein
MQRLHVGDRRNACVFAPKKELARRLAVRPARVFVADLRGEEFKEADFERARRRRRLV